MVYPVLANSSHYSGNGFTLEPQNKEEYFKYLSDISKLHKISEQTINKAKTFLFLEIMLGRVNIPLIPNYDIGHNFFLNQIVKNSGMNVQVFYQTIIKMINLFIILKNKLSQIINI